MKKFSKPPFNFLLLFFFLFVITQRSVAQAPVAPVNPPSTGFYINGKLKADSADVGDWVDGAGTGGFVLQSAGAPPVWGAVNPVTTKFIKDSFDNAADLIFQGSSFGDNPNSWQWTASKATAKCDINTALFHSTTSATQKWLILGGDRFATTGTSYIDFQFSQGIFTRTGTGTSGGFSSLAADGSSLAATNGRTVGDFVLSMEYTNGGAIATVHYYRWQASGNTYKFVELPIPTPGGVASAYGASNTAATDVPYGAFGSTSYIPFAFVEAAVNIDAILTGSCQSVSIKTIFVSTKASDSYSAALKDFVDPQPVNFVFGNAGLSYSAPSFCKNGTNPAPTVPNPIAGSFAGSAGLSINASTGVINLAATDAGSYTATYTPTGGVCLTPATAVITIVANPAALTLTGSSICTSVTGTGTITSSTSVSGVSYQLYNSSNTTVQSAKAGTGSGLTWSNVPAGTGYYAIATGAAPTSCTSGNSNTVDVVEVANPVALSLTGSSICATAPNTGTISSTTSGANTISYQLYNSSNAPVQSAKTGTGGILTWTGLAAANGYYVIATGASPTSCTSTSNTADVISVTNPTALVLSGSSICATAPNTGTISSTTSGPNTISYQLYNSSNETVQSAKLGTGGILTWTGLAAGNGYYVIATGAAPTNCTSTSNTADVTSVANPTALSLTGSSICASAVNTGTISSTTSGPNTISYQLYNSSNATVQSAKLGTGGALTWTGLAAGTGYYVIATGAAPTNCTSTSNTADVTSVANPTALVLNGSTICASNPNTGTISSTTSGANTISYQLYNSSNATVQSAKPGTGGVLTWTGLAAANGYYVIATGAGATACQSTSNSVNVASVSNPAPPTVSTINPTCSTSHGSITVTAPLGAEYQYSFNDAAYTTSTGPFSFQAGAGYSIVAKNTTTGCISSVGSCAEEVIPLSSNRVSSSQEIQTTDSRTNVKAYPNPFSDRVKFLITSAEAGNGSLEVYNMMGQKVKTVYTGFIAAGTQTFELSMPTQQVANLVYVLRIGDKKMTGKILQINK